MEKVKFILPSNEIIELNMWEVSKFCKSICLKAENIVAFLEFEKDYTKFDAYFDFVVFHLNYLYSIGNRYFIPSEEELNNLFEVKVSELESISYQSLLHVIIDHFQTAFLTKCSDSELQIAKLDSSYPRPAFMDEEFTCYFNSTKGSHLTTGQTIWNQFLINNEELCFDYEKFTNSCVKKQYDGIEMDYMMKRFGFARLDGENIIMIAKREYGKELSDYLKDCEELGYIFTYLSCYKQIIFQQYKNVVFKKQEDLQERLKV